MVELANSLPEALQKCWASGSYFYLIQSERRARCATQELPYIPVLLRT